MTWSGGHTPTGLDSIFWFLAQPASSQTYTFQVQQTYSDGSIVNWSGPESSDSPAPTIEVKDSLGGGSTSVLTIIALRRRDPGACSRRPRAGEPRRFQGAVAGVNDAPSDEVGRARGGGNRRRVRVPGCGFGARVPGPHESRRQRSPQQPSKAGRTDVRRGRRAEVRDHLGDQRERHTGDDRAGQPLAGEPRHARRAAAAPPARRLVPRSTGARFPSTATPCRAAFTYAVGPQSGPGAAVPGTERLRDGEDSPVADHAMADVPERDERGRAVRAADADRPAGSSPRARSEPATPLKSRSWLRASSA